MRHLLVTTALVLAAAGGAQAASTLADTLDNDVEDVRGAAYPDTFAGQLAAAYRDLAVFEADRMVDWIDAEWFAQRAKRAADGDIPEPTRPENWAIESPRRLAELQAARAALTGVLNDGAADAAPAQAAAAQASFDCWVEQQEEAWQAFDIALCRNEFLFNARALRAALSETRPDLAGRLFFEFDESDLNPAARTTLELIADALKAEGVEEVVVVGHADTAGSDAYNRALSLRRAKTVANALRGMGVGGVSVNADVSVIGAGEEAPLAETGDGVRMALNRRVAIFEGEPPVGLATR